MRHVTSVHESDCDVKKWHIARVSKTSAKKCFALQANTRRNCQEKIVRMGKNTPAPMYTGVMEVRRQGKEVVMDCFHCSDDIERCVKDTNGTWVRGI